MKLIDPLTQFFVPSILSVALAFVILVITFSIAKVQPSITRATNLLHVSPQTSLKARIQQLESEKKALKHEPRKRKRRLSDWVAYTLLFSGAIALVTSILYSSSILAFVGLGLTFWGGLLLFIRPTKYVKASLLDATALSSLRTIDQIIAGLNYKGKAVYLSPAYLKTLKGGMVFIPSEKNLSIPPIEKVAEQKVFLKDPQGICLNPPGLGLVNLYENVLGKDFTKVDLNYLKNNLPKLFIEDLEIAEDLKVNIKDNMVRVEIAKSVYKDLCNDVRKLPNVCASIGCPICSSIAIALTRATGKSVAIEKTEVPKDGKTIEANFRLLEITTSEIQTEELLAEVSRLRARARLLSNLASLFLTAFGSIVLAWVSWLTWYDMTEWGKNIGLIFFGSRTGEAISLGIGMKVIYYFLIGSALLLSGLLILLQRRRSKV